MQINMMMVMINQLTVTLFGRCLCAVNLERCGIALTVSEVGKDQLENGATI